MIPRIGWLCLLLPVAAFLLYGCGDQESGYDSGPVKCIFSVQPDPEDNTSDVGVCNEQMTDDAIPIVLDETALSLSTGERYSMELTPSGDPCGQGQSGCQRVLTANSLRNAPRAALKDKGFVTMDILMVICQFTDYKVDYVTESSVVTELYGSKSMKEMLETDTFGRVRLDQNYMKVTTVNMGMSLSQLGGCNPNKAAQVAKAKVKLQGIDPDSFTFREFFLPKQIPCGWAGLASLGCGHPPSLPNPGACHAWYKIQGTFVRGHELGHNLGLSHGGGPSKWWSSQIDWNSQYIEYGDKQSAMGNNFQNLAGYTTYGRNAIGVLNWKKGEALELEGYKDYKICSMTRFNVPPSASTCDAIGLMIPCGTGSSSDPCMPRQSSKAAFKGGDYWISFRDEQHFSAPLAANLKNKVYVHLARKATNPKYGRGTEAWAILSVGDSFTINNYNKIVVTFKSMNNGVATVNINGPGGPPPTPTKSACDTLVNGECKACVEKAMSSCKYKNPWDPQCEAICTHVLCKNKCHAPPTPTPAPPSTPSPTPPGGSGKSVCSKDVPGVCRSCVWAIDSWCKNNWDNMCTQACTKQTPYTNGYNCSPSCEVTTKASWG